MDKEILAIILEGIEIINQNLDNPLPIHSGMECPIYGGINGVDSISLVSLISIVEDSLENQLGLSVILANEKAMSMRNSPFLTVGSLVSYIDSLIVLQGKQA